MRIALAFMFFILCSCGGILTWKSVYSSIGPDGKSELGVEIKGCLADCAVQVVVKRGWFSERIAAGNDCIVTFAHAAWSGTKVAVFIDGLFCGSIKVAFDTSSGRTIEFRTAEAWLRKSMIESYAVSREELDANGGDVFIWATYPGDGSSRRSMTEFRVRHLQP